MTNPKPDFDPFSVEALRETTSSGETIIRLSRKHARKAAPKEDIYAVLPLSWIIQLDKDATAETWRLAARLLYLHFKHHRHSFNLTNQAISDIGDLKISRASKWRALVYLEARRLILVERRGNRSPTVTCLKVPQLQRR